MAEILTIGEPLVLFASTDLNKKLKDAEHFSKYLAGAETNVAIGLQRLNHTVSYITQIGTDPLGEFVLSELQKHHIDTKNVYMSSSFPTGIEFKNRVSNGDPETFYLRKNSATAHLNFESINNLNISDTKYAHITGIFPALSADTLDTTEQLIKYLLHRDISISFDPNLRPSLWPSEIVMKTAINKLALSSNIFLPGLKEARLLSGLKDFEAIADYYLSNSPQMKLIVIKDGAKGCYLQTINGYSNFVSSFKVDHVVDTVGAGDGFALGLLSALLENKSLKQAAIRANAIGALAIQSAGDNTGYPTQYELADFLQRNLINSR